MEKVHRCTGGWGGAGGWSTDHGIKHESFHCFLGSPPLREKLNSIVL